MLNFLYWKEPVYYESFHWSVNRNKYYIEDLREAHDFPYHYISMYFCKMAHPHLVTFKEIGDEITVGEDQFTIFTAYYNMFKKTIIVGQKTGDRFFMYAFTTDKSLGLAVGLPLFFERETGKLFIPLVKARGNSIYEYQGSFHNRWEEQPLMNIAGEKQGNIEMENVQIEYKIPIYTYAVPGFLAREKWLNQVIATYKWYEEGMLNFPKWDQGKEVIWEERKEGPRGSMLPY